jgi:hypothetical protein
VTSPAISTVVNTQNASYSSKVAEALTLAQSKRLSGWNASHQRLIQRCWSGKASPRQALKAQCLDCVGQDRQAIADCADRCCPLWQYRPYKQSRTTNTEP